MELTKETAARFARAALGHVAREYPHKLDHVMEGDADVRPPRALHPCFFGSFDWHSCVHGWWTLLTLRRLFPGLPEAAQIAELADKTFVAENLATELAYAQAPSARGFERPYGWGWLLYLHHEAARHDEEWAARIEPLARHFAARFKDYLGVLTYPVFVGTHYNTAFALTLAREWAAARDAELAAAIDRWSGNAFAHRSDYRGWEPGGDEFLSPVLSAALLMHRVLPSQEFAPWFAALVLDNGWIADLSPATVSDRSDGKVAHLDGLNLSRAWALHEIAPTLGHSNDREMLCAKAAAHLEVALPHVTGDYMGEHWLASFALLALLAEGSDIGE
ncbi:DUF2891 domain-containing protein [Alteriqipengyuania sp. 357]